MFRIHARIIFWTCVFIIFAVSLQGACSPFVVSSDVAQVAQLPYLTLAGGEFPTGQSTLPVIEASLSAGTCANVTVISDSLAVCEFGIHPYEGQLQDVLPLYLVNLTIDGNPVTMFNKSLSGNVLSNSPILISTLRQMPYVNSSFYALNDDIMMLYFIGDYFDSSESLLDVQVRTSASPELTCVVTQATTLLFACKLVEIQLLTAGPFEAKIVIQQGVSTGWIDIGLTLTSEISPIQNSSITPYIYADAASFSIRGRFFAPSNVDVFLTQQDRVPLTDYLDCIVTTASPTLLECSLADVSNVTWAAGTLRAIVAVSTPVYGTFLSTSSPIAVLQPVISRVISELELPVPPIRPSLTISGVGFADPAATSSVSVSLRAEYSLETNLTCDPLFWNTTQITCALPAGITAGRYEAFVQIVTSLVFDVNAPPVPDSSLVSGWFPVVDLIPRISRSSFFIYLDLVPNDGIDIIISGSGFSQTLSDNRVVLNVGGSTFSCSVQLVSQRQLTCRVQKANLQLGEILCVASVHNITSNPQTLGVVLASQGGPVAVVAVSYGGAIAAAVLVSLVGIVGIAAAVYAVRRRYLQQRQDAPEGYKTHHDRIPIGEVLAALTPEDGTDMSAVEKSPRVEESAQHASGNTTDQGQSSTDSASESPRETEVSVDTESE